MLAGSLYSSYAQYKADSDFVATWLANTAQRCGHHVADETIAPKAPRLKGRARKLAREAEKSSKTEGSSSGQSRRVLKIKDFISLAERIAYSTRPCVEVPASFDHRLQRAIKLRRLHQDWHKKQGETSKVSNEQDGHGHFITVLESVREILLPNRRSTRSESMPKTPTPACNTDFANAFAGLDIEEPTADSLDAEPAGDLEITHVVDTASEPSERRDEGLFARCCFSVDMHRIRRFLQVLWRTYAEGRPDIVAVSITTNTAIDFVRRLEEDFNATFPGHGELGCQTCFACAYEAWDSKTESFAGDRLIDSCLRSPHKVLSFYLQNELIDEDPARYVPTPVPAYRELYDQTIDRISASKEDRQYQDYKLIMGVIPELQVLALYTDAGLQAEHEVLRGLRQMIQKKKLVPWLTFAVQVMLDVRHILRDNITKGHADLIRGAQAIKQNILKVLHFHEQANIPGASMGTDQSLRQLLALIDDWIYDDFVDIVRRQRQADESHSDAIPKHYLLKRDPLWCGLLLYNFRAVAYEGAIIMANSWTTILTVAHLYNHMRQVNLVTSRWPQMENIFATHGVTGIFVGELPKSAVECAKQFTLATGISPTAYAPDRRRGRVKLSHAKIRGFERQTPVSWLFKHRYCDQSGRVDLRPSDVKEALRGKVEAKDNKSELASPQNHNDICHLLLRLAASLHDEAFEMTFDYFGLHTTCWKILRRLENTLGHFFDDWEEYRHNERHLPSFVFWILTEAARAERLANGSQTWVVEEAARILQRFIVSFGDKVPEGVMN